MVAYRRNHTMMVRRLACVWISLMLWTRAVWAAGTPIDLTELTLEELMDIEIISVSKKEERLFEAAAAVYVITQEDLRRSGVRSIPAVLRLVPGMQVARIDANKWAVTARGFLGLFANKLLVLIDGRSVYTPLFSGVFWEAQDVVLEDVERIEVIRGPGGALWGANAVNGIINIITKPAEDAQGGFMQAGGGTEERGFGTVRYGGRLGERVHFQAYGKYFARDASVDRAGRGREDDWYVFRIGGRVDWRISSQSMATVQGDVYDGQVGQVVRIATPLSPPYMRTVYSDAQISGGNVLARWERKSDDRSGVALQFYWDRSARTETVLKGVVHNADVDVQQRWEVSSRHEIVWGLEYRLTMDDLDGGPIMSFRPECRTVHLFSGFVHNDVSLASDRMRLMLGSKIEHNNYTGIEVQPDVRLWWSPAQGHALWGALSRAVRTPSRGEDDIRAVTQVWPSDSLYAGSPLAAATLLGNRAFDSETVLAFDAGYRAHLRTWLSLDVAAFHNLYDDLRTKELDLGSIEAAPSGSHLIVPVWVDNKAGGRTYGVELAADGQVRDGWRLRAAYTYFHMDLDVDEDSFDALTESYARENPGHLLSVRFLLDLPGAVELDLIGRYMDDLPTLDIDRYLTFDLCIGWRPNERLELSIAGRNLLDSPRPEFVSQASGVLPAEVQAGVYSTMTWRF